MSEVNVRNQGLHGVECCGSKTFSLSRKQLAMNGSNDMTESQVLSELAEICADPPDTRQICEDCRRPVTVCWCQFLPEQRLNINTNIYILQHPFEETRPLQTARILHQAVQPGKCTIVRGKRFSTEKFPDLRRQLAAPNTLLMFPGPEAVDLDVFLSQHTSTSDSPESHYNLLLLDGTWAQAKGLLFKNPWLKNCKQVQLSNTGLSEYTIRTQPTDASLSTLETGAIALSLLEGSPNIHEILVEPLRALCKFQFDFGAVPHHSKQYLFENGLCYKQHKIKPKQTVLGRSSPL